MNMQSLLLIYKMNYASARLRLKYIRPYARAESACSILPACFD